MLHEVLRGSEIEPWVEFMDDTLESDDREESTRHCSCRDSTEDDYPQQAPRIPACAPLEERVEGGGRDGHDFSRLRKGQVYISQIN